MSRRRRGRRRIARTGSLGALVIALLTGAFFVLRSNPSLQSNLPPVVRTFINSINLPTGVPTTPIPAGGQQPTGNAQIGVRTKTTGCHAVNALSDGGCTPGAIFSNVTTDQICQSGYASSVRNVPDSEKNEVYAEYGIISRSAGEYEVDHLISLELGGSNDIANLWPEAAEPKPGFHEKDQVENYLHDQVCKHQVSLQQAQQEISTNWLAVYQQMTK